MPAVIAAGVHAAAPPPPATVAVPVATTDLPAGVELEEGDVTTAELPPEAVPDGVAEAPVGELLAAPVRRGEPVTDVRLVGAGLVAEAEGDVALPVRLSDAAQAALLSVGDRIDLLATDPQAGETSTVAEGLVVLALPEGEPGGDGALSGRLVVVAVPPFLIEQVTTATVTSFVTYAWSGR